MTRENNRLKSEIRALKQSRNPYRKAALPPRGRALRTSDGQPICNRCNQVGHTQGACPRNNQGQGRNNAPRSNQLQRNGPPRNQGQQTTNSFGRRRQNA